MPDMERAAMTEFVYRRLADPAFRDRLTAKAPDGSKPIVIALRTDSVRWLLGQVDAAGRSANVVVPFLNGAYVIAMDEVPEAETKGEQRHRLTADCTVGVLIERLSCDGNSGTYTFVVDGPADGIGAGRAELVALAG